MKRNRSLARRNVAVSNPAGISLGTIAIVVLVGLVIYLIWKSRGTASAGSYRNEESWDVQYNLEGLPTKITIHRDARRS